VGAVIATVPLDAAGQGGTSKLPIIRVLCTPGIVVILAVIFTWRLAHSTIYT
jgi:predicted MFS family arabinose efflux permease